MTFLTEPSGYDQSPEGEKDESSTGFSMTESTGWPVRCAVAETTPGRHWVLHASVWAVIRGDVDVRPAPLSIARLRLCPHQAIVSGVSSEVRIAFVENQIRDGRTVRAGR